MALKEAHLRIHFGAIPGVTVSEHKNVCFTSRSKKNPNQVFSQQQPFYVELAMYARVAHGINQKNAVIVYKEKYAEVHLGKEVIILEFE